VLGIADSALGLFGPRCVVPATIQANYAPAIARGWPVSDLRMTREMFGRGHAVKQELAETGATASLRE
jgi:hypothetical protein